MKKATRIVIIIDMILRFWMITPIIFGVLALKKLKATNVREEMSAGFSIAMLILGSTVGGIFMLTMTEDQWKVPLFPEEEEKEPEPEVEPAPAVAVLTEEIPLPELIADIINVENTVKFSRKEDIRIFQERLYRSSVDLKRRYATIDSFLYGIDRVRVNYSEKYQTFKAGAVSIAKMTVKNDAIYVYLAVDPKKYVGSKYVYKDVSESSGFSSYPMRLKVTGDAQVEDVKEIVSDLIREQGLTLK